MDIIKKMKCVHVYLRKTKTVAQNMGFADFIRGTIYLKQLSDRLKFDFYIEKDSHDIFKFLEPNEKIISTNYQKDNVAEFFNTCPKNIIKFLKQNKNSSCLWISTHIPYLNKENQNLNWGILRAKDKNFIRDILRPSAQIKQKIKYIKENIYKTNNYNIIHVRTNDAFFNNSIDKSFYFEVERRISNLLKKNHHNENYILMSNSKSLCKKIISKFPEIKYWNNSKEHIGNYTDISKIEDGITDYFIMSQAKKIYVISAYGCSGFSESIHKIFDVEYEKI
jgi:hypothetical protein